MSEESEEYSFQIRDRVIYEDVEYTIEKKYENCDVYLIGNDDEFCDMVPGHMLTLSDSED